MECQPSAHGCKTATLTSHFLLQQLTEVRSLVIIEFIQTNLHIMVVERLTQWTLTPIRKLSSILRLIEHVVKSWVTTNKLNRNMVIESYRYLTGLLYTWQDSCILADYSCGYGLPFQLFRFSHFLLMFSQQSFLFWRWGDDNKVLKH